MVDPLEAKRLAAKQMQEIQAREKLKVSNYLLLCIGVRFAFNFEQQYPS